jgi:hypothetical protein
MMSESRFTCIGMMLEQFCMLSVFVPPRLCLLADAQLVGARSLCVVIIG